MAQSNATASNVASVNAVPGSEVNVRAYDAGGRLEGHSPVTTGIWSASEGCCRGATDEVPVQREVIADHAFRGEGGLDPRPAVGAVEARHEVDCRGHVALVLAEKAAAIVLDDLRWPSAKLRTGVPQASASIITSPKGSGQRIGLSSASALASSSSLRLPPTSPT